MYLTYEQPQISATIFYFDYEYSQETAEKVITTAEQFGLFSLGRIIAGKLTRNRFQKYRPSMRDLAVRAYFEKDILNLSWEQNDPCSGADIISFCWTFTFYKLSHIDPTKSTFKPWNTLTLSAAYSWLEDKTNYTRFMEAVKALIHVLRPFYANIDDVAQAVTLFRKVRAPHFVPETIQQVYWGNYWGSQFKQQIEFLRSQNVPIAYSEEINDGLFFTLSESVFDFNSKDVNALRKKIFSAIK